MTFEDDLLALEQRVLADAAGDFLTAVDELRRMLVTGALGMERKLINLAIPQVEAAATAGIAEGYAMGGDWAIGSAQLATDVTRSQVGDARLRLDVGPAAPVLEPVKGLDRRLQDAHTTAKVLLSSGSRVEEALAPIFGAAASTRAVFTTQINAASNAASLTVGEVVRSPMVWEAERSACVYCLALAGHVVKSAGDLFPKANLYADGPTAEKTLSQPPLHPFCRCRISVLADPSYAEALMREAQRSILRGFSLPSESQAARVRAAKRLLDNDPIAPKSVKAYAQRAVRLGRFPNGREVPSGGPRLVTSDRRPSTDPAAPAP